MWSCSSARPAAGARHRFTLALTCIALVLAVACGDNRTSAEIAREELAKGLAAHRAGDIEGAESSYSKVLEHSPQDAYALFNLGVIAQSREDAEGAERFYREALSILPEMTQALYNLAILRADAGDDTEAEQLYLQVLELDPDYAAAHLNLGFVYREMGDEERAQEHFARATELDASLEARIPATPEPAAEGD